MASHQKLIVICGPTASGKSAVAMQVAKKLNGEIVSADSMQVYRGMTVGTAKPGRAEQKTVKHHLLDLVSPSKKFSVFQYYQAAVKTLNDLKIRKKVPVVTGGSGLYLRSLLQGLDVLPGADEKFRKKLCDEAEKKGVPALYRRLLALDPKRASKIKSTDLRRIIRALEIFFFSAKEKTPIRQNPPVNRLGWKPFVFCLGGERQELYDRINRRVDSMFRKGFLKEAERLSKKQISTTARQALGYRELFGFFDQSKDLSLNEKKKLLHKTKETIKQNTRRFAKRQLTWFRREKEAIWLNATGSSPAQLCDKIVEYVRKGSLRA